MITVIYIFYEVRQIHGNVSLSLANSVSIELLLASKLDVNFVKETTE